MNHLIKIIIVNILLLVLLGFGIVVNFALSNHLSNTETKNNYPAAIEKINTSEDINWLKKSFTSTVILRRNTDSGLITWHNRSIYFLLLLGGLCLVNVYFLIKLKKHLLAEQS